jgi:hypothetical protein
MLQIKSYEVGMLFLMMRRTSRSGMASLCSSGASIVDIHLAGELERKYDCIEFFYSHYT